MSSGKRLKISDLKQDFHVSGTPKQLDVSKIRKKTRKTAVKKSYCLNKKTSKVQENDLQDEDVNYVDFAAESSQSSELHVHDIVTTLDPLETYIHTLKQQNGLCPVNSNYSTFYIRDFTKIQNLHASKHFFVTRASIHFTDKSEWVYRCTCSKSENDLVASLFVYCDISHQEFLTQAHYCLHIKAVDYIMIDFDLRHGLTPSDPDSAVSDHTYSGKVISPELEQGLYTVSNKSAICCQTEDGYGVVYSEPGKFKCLTCTYGTSCSHTTFIKKQIDSQSVPDVLDDILAIYSEHPGDKKPSYIPECLSKQKIPYQLQEKHKIIISKPHSQRFEIDENGICNLKAQSPLSCECDLDMLRYVCTDMVLLITQNKTYKARVYKKVCYSCERETLYDGSENCVLDMGNYIVAWEVLRNFMSHFLFGSSTMITSYEVLLRQHQDSGFNNTKNKFSYSHFRWAWYSFLHLLDIDYDSSFSCEMCNGEIIVCDATSLSFRRELLSWKEYLVKPTHEKAPKVTDRKFNRRILLPSKPIRNEVAMFAASHKGISKASFDRIVQLCNSYDLQEFVAFMEDIKECEEELVKCPTVWREFLRNVSVPSPACALFHPSEELDKLIKEIGEYDIRRNIVKMRQLQENIPLIFNIVKNADIIPDTFWILLKKINKIAKVPFQQDTQVIDKNKNSLRDSELIYFPKMPLSQNRGTYAQDGVKRVESCKKSFRGHPTLLPGIFTAYCPHGKCYGFQVMMVHESPDVPFTFLRTRFKQAPKLVIYDNACNLHAYCLNRDPVFFKDTWFLVDSLHWANHKGCCVGYCLKKYPQYQAINSQVVEQSNSLLKRIKNMLSYMNQKNFIAHVKLFLWARNMGFPQY